MNRRLQTVGRPRKAGGGLIAAGPSRHPGEGGGLEKGTPGGFVLHSVLDLCKVDSWL